MQTPKNHIMLVRGAKTAKLPKFTGPRDIHDAYMHLADLGQEEFHVVAVDNKNKVIDDYMVSHGSLISSIVHPREVFKFALLCNAASIICVHNHPSGDPKPSQKDLEVTKRLRDVGEMIGINVLDHIIIGDGYYFAFRESGMVEF